jgi:phosphoglycolate phosphatase-like HAD superfamily hydrolase
MNGRNHLRVILFDIDGTLIRAVRRGEYRGLIRDMLIDIFGTYGRIGEVDFAGKTDLAIYREALEPAGVSLSAIHQRLPVVERAMVEMLDYLASTGEVFRLCPGVRELLDTISSDNRFVTSLLTGNVERLALAKLRVAGIGNYFTIRGAYGSDAEDRDHLPAIAAERISLLLERNLSPDQFIIIGDTPRDISCARHFGARSLAVASGPHTAASLAEFEPDALLEDLGDTGAVMKLLSDI